MTPNEITTLLAQQLDKTFDVPFKLAMIKRVDVWRSRLIKNSLDKNPKDRSFFIQTLFLKTVESSEAPCDLPVTLCSTWVTDIVPAPLRANSMLFDYVGGINGMNPFTSPPTGSIAYMKSGKYSKNMTFYDYVNGRIVLYDNVPMIRVEFIADNPSEIEKFSCTPDGSLCDFWNSEYPCSNDILQLILQSIKEIDYKEIEQLGPSEYSIPVDPLSKVVS